MDPETKPLSPVSIFVALGGIAGLFVLAYQFRPSPANCITGTVGSTCTPSNVYWAVFWGAMWVLSSFWFAFLCAQGTPKTDGGPGERRLFANFMMSGIIGGAAGWLLGVYFFPIDDNQAQAFNHVATMVGGIISGFLLKELTNMLQYVTKTDNNSGPLIFKAPYRECLAFFLASLMVSGGVQVAIRNLGDIRVSWDGTAPHLDKNGARFEIELHKTYHLSGAALGSTNIAVRWRLEALSAEDNDKLRATDLISIGPDGTLTTAEEAKWKQASEFDFVVVASAADRPEVSKALPLHLKLTTTLPEAVTKKTAVMPTPATPAPAAK